MKILLNSTQVSYFILGAYVDTGLFRYPFFLIVLCLYVMIIVSNVLLIAVICMNRSLHEPMYLVLCSLFVNELYGSMGMYPFLMLNILSNVHIVSASFCLLQVFCLYSYGGVEFFTLAMMSYDRYLAICHPLQYNTRLTATKIPWLIALTWLYPLLNNIFYVYCRTAPLQLCGNIINKVYCDNYSIIRLSCFDTSVHNIIGLVHIFTIIFCLIMLILYTYMRILRVCVMGSKQARQKALSTCVPHLISLFNFATGAFFEIIQSRFNMSHIPNIARIALSLYWLTCQPLINPLLYGLQMSKIRIVYKNLVFRRKV
ncbi:olfactory receptor 5P6-like [Solea solea]|uniref:olfactory receptor 5P6-like n=1 Tax=Solea solea TaxID=90069 RepID=UPI00272BF4B1|nr:olfactory receptor 5P6-like [Solea solea]